MFCQQSPSLWLYFFVNSVLKAVCNFDELQFISIFFYGSFLCSKKFLYASRKCTTFPTRQKFYIFNFYI